MYKRQHCCFMLFLCATLVLLLALPASGFGQNKTSASDKKAVELANRVQDRYRQFRSLEFSFDQTSLSSGRFRQGQGKAMFYRGQLPDKKNAGSTVMRWEYTKPTAQTITNDGNEVAIYTPEEKQVLIVPSADMASDPSYALFVGSKQLSETFFIRGGDKQFLMNDAPKDCDAVLLIPRESHPQISRIQVWVDKKLDIRRLLMEDHFASLTELNFSNIRINTRPANDPKQRNQLLELNLLPGTEVIRQ